MLNFEIVEKVKKNQSISAQNYCNNLITNKLFVKS